MKKFLTPLLAVLLTGCAGHQTKNPTKLYVFDCGEINVGDISVFSPGHDKGKKKRLTNSCYLIKHPKGNFLWDTGLPDQLAKKKSGVKKAGGLFHLKVSNTLESQLSEIGITPKDITHMGISHYHFDHTGNMNLFTNAKVYIQKEEYNAAYSKDPSKYSFDPTSYSKINKSNYVKLDGDHDVFGDGTVKIISAHGHTLGHQVLLVNLEREGPILISGDLYHFTKNREHKRIPSFNADKEKSVQAFNKVESLVEKLDAKFWIQHDLEQNQKIRHSPLHYK